MKKLEKLSFAEFSLKQLSNLKSITGGLRDTTWTETPGGATGTDTNDGGKTSFSDGTSSDKDSKK